MPFITVVVFPAARKAGTGENPFRIADNRVLVLRGYDFSQDGIDMPFVEIFYTVAKNHSGRFKR